jgi:hypothetical protein
MQPAPHGTTSSAPAAAQTIATAIDASPTADSCRRNQTIRKGYRRRPISNCINSSSWQMEKLMQFGG